MRMDNEKILSISQAVFFEVAGEAKKTEGLRTLLADGSPLAHQCVADIMEVANSDVEFDEPVKVGGVLVKKLMSGAFGPSNSFVYG